MIHGLLRPFHSARSDFGNKTYAKWRAIESAAVQLIVVGIGCFVIATSISVINYIQFGLGCVTGGLVFFLYYLQLTQRVTLVVMLSVMTVALAGTTVALWVAQPLWVTFLNGFGGLLAVLGSIALLVKTRT